MLIKIDYSVVSDAVSSNIWSQDILLALELLAIARREGKHVIISELKTLEVIRHCEHLPQSIRDIYNRIYSSFSQTSAYLSIVNRYIEITNPCHTPSVSSHLGKEIIRVPPSFFNDSMKVQKAILLCEHSSDTALYEAIAKAFLVWMNQARTQLAYEPRGGGGSSIFVEYANIQRTGERMCLCIVDSDRKAPNSSLGDTATTIQSHSNPNNLITQLSILDAREAENLIPHQILSEIAQGNRERLEFLTILESIQNSNGREVRKFIDIKEGTFLREIINSGDSSIKLFWQANIFTIPSSLAVTNSWCWTNWQCEQHQQAKNKNPQSCPCNCIIVPHFGRNTLENTTEWLERKSPHEVARKVDQYLRSDWEKLGQIIVDWGLAERPLYA
jgi:hypothetical protein